MATDTLSTPMTSRFDRMLSRHLANHIVAGVNCDEAVVRECYVQTWKDLRPRNCGILDDPCVREIESFFMDNVVSLMQTHQRFVATMPIPVASAFIGELLHDKLW